MFAVLWYSTTATRTPLPWSPLPLVQFAPTVVPADDMNVRHSCSRPRLRTSGRSATAATPAAGRSTNMSGADVLTYATDPPTAVISASIASAAAAYTARRASQSSARRARACSSVVGIGRPASHSTSGCACSTALSAGVTSTSSQIATRSGPLGAGARTAATSDASALRSRTGNAASAAALASSSSATVPVVPSARR